MNDEIKMDLLNDEINQLRNELEQIKEVLSSSNQLIKQFNNEIKPIKTDIANFNNKLSSSIFKDIGHILGKTIASNQLDYRKVSYNIAKDFIADHKEDIFSFTKNIFNKLGGARATGGNVGGGVPYLVGEKGPEIFIPHGGGYIDNDPSKKTNNIKIEMHINTNDIGSFNKSKKQIIAEAIRHIRQATNTNSHN